MSIRALGRQFRQRRAIKRALKRDSQLTPEEDAWSDVGKNWNATDASSLKPSTDDYFLGKKGTSGGVNERLYDHGVYAHATMKDPTGTKRSSG